MSQVTVESPGLLLQESLENSQPDDFLVLLMDEAERNIATKQSSSARIQRVSPAYQPVKVRYARD